MLASFWSLILPIAFSLMYLVSGADYKVICYLEAWAVYWKDARQSFGPAFIDPFACTHLIHSFIGLDSTTFTVRILDPDYEVNRGGFKAAIDLKHVNPELKVMVAIGGWDDGSKQYSEMVSTPDRRKIFIDSVVQFIETHQFDGLDLDWEYPGSKDRDGCPEDKENFASLVEELSVIFRPRNWLLSAAVPGAVTRIDDGYDVPRLAKVLDFFNVMTYEFHGIWEDFVDHHSPLWRRSFDLNDTSEFHSDGALSGWIRKGAPADKVIFGLPFFGRGFKLADPNKNRPRSASLGKGVVGPVTGGLAYFEICTLLKEGDWKELQDEAGSPYILKDDQWIGYDTADSILAKMEYVKSRGLGGVMIWAIELDDTHGICGPERPLMNAVHQGLGLVSSLSFDCLRLKKKGYKLTGLYSVKSEKRGLKTIYCDFTDHRQNANHQQFITQNNPLVSYYYGKRLL